MELYENTLKILKDLNIHFDEISHEESHSCEQSREFRNNAWLEWLWSKNIVFHAKWKFYLVTTYWDKQIKARNFKHEWGTKDIRFANGDEIYSCLWAKIGSIPPIWFLNSEIPIFVDSEIFENKFFIFNPWDPKKSIRVTTNDLRSIYDKLKNPIRYFIHTEENFQINPEI